MSTTSRRQFVHGSLALAGLALLSGCGLVALARPEPKRAARVGFLDSTAPQVTAPGLDAFRQGMRARGYEENRDYILESRYSAGREELLPGLAAELVSLPVDVLLATTLIAITAAKNATAAIPIVMTGIASDPVAFGLVESLARPGGNVTGTANSGVRLVGKRVELLKQLLPSLARLAMFQDVASPGNAGNVAEAQAAARTLDVQLTSCRCGARTTSTRRSRPPSERTPRRCSCWAARFSRATAPVSSSSRPGTTCRRSTGRATGRRRGA